MKKDKLTTLGFNLLAGGIFVAIIYFIPKFTDKVNPHLIQYLFPLCLVLAVIFASFYLTLQKKQQLKKDPSGNTNSLHGFTMMLCLLTILVAAVPIINFVEKEDQIPDNFALVAAVIVTLLMWNALKIFKQQQKRIDTLEEKLNNKQRQDQQDKK